MFHSNNPMNNRYKPLTAKPALFPEVIPEYWKDDNISVDYFDPDFLPNKK